MKIQLIIILTLITVCNVEARSLSTDSLEKLLPTTQKTSHRIDILSKLTWQLRNSDLKKALSYGLQHIALIRKSGNPQALAQANNYVGIIYRNLGDYSQAMRYHYKALTLAQQHQVIDQKAYCYNNIGDLLGRQGNLLDARKNIQRAIDLFVQLKNDRGEAYGYLRLGEVLQQEGKYDEALTAFFKALDLRKKMKAAKADLSAPLQRIGVLYGVQHKYKEAMLYLGKALRQDVVNQDIRGMCSVQNDMSAIYLQQNKTQEVIRQATDTWQHASEIMAKPIMYRTARLLQQAYEKQKNYVKAYYYQQQYVSTLEDFLNEQRGNQLDALRYSHQLEKQQVELDLKDKDIQLLQQAQKEHRLRQSLVYALFAAIVLLGGLITALVRGNLRKKKANHLLQNRNQEIAEKNYEIVVQNKELHAQQEEIRAQHDSIELQNRHITQSIQAAKTIQEAILPQEERIKQMFEQYFVIYRPRDVVSGDFYWAGKVGNTRILGAIDCTGHGVPGAFMSMIGFALLNEIIKTKKVTNPGEVLTRLRLEVKKALSQEETRNKDGMDAGLIAVEDQSDGKVKVAFAGAKRPLWYMTKDCSRLQVVEGSRVSIGLTYQDKRVIETKTYLFDKGTQLYLSSDGFADQNNVARRKFGTKRLLELIYMIGKYPLYKQKKVLDNDLDEFMRDTEQRDDILLMGVKL
ncbi:tetratricopeptide repeat protein [Microscilla marina]|uniref:tetratricopeptide repeat protein n=1 Tax=Microscilla marina TaxID=1027 RepID=UPI00031F35A0|nr:tetratricopeptide repeat protein [Microscilla marina]